MQDGGRLGRGWGRGSGRGRRSRYEDEDDGGAMTLDEFEARQKQGRVTGKPDPKALVDHK